MSTVHHLLPRRAPAGGGGAHARATSTGSGAHAARSSAACAPPVLVESAAAPAEAGGLDAWTAYADPAQFVERVCGHGQGPAGEVSFSEHLTGQGTLPK